MAIPSTIKAVVLYEADAMRLEAAPVPHSARVRGWTITPSHFPNRQLDTVWLVE